MVTVDDVPLSLTRVEDVRRAVGMEWQKQLVAAVRGVPALANVLQSAVGSERLASRDGELPRSSMTPMCSSSFIFSG